MPVWKDIISKDEYLALEDEKRVQVRDAFFRRFVLPNAPKGMERGIYDAFINKTQKDVTVPSRSFWKAADDYAVECANYVVGAVKTIPDMIEPGNPISSAMGQFIDYGEGLQSDVAKRSKAKMRRDLKKAQGFGDEVSAVMKYAVDSPLLMASQVAGSFAIPAGSIKGVKAASKALGASEKVAARIGLGAGGVTSSMMSGGDAAGDAYDQVMQIPDEVLFKNKDAQDLLLQGMTKSEVRHQLAKSAGHDASIIPAIVGLGTGLTGAESILAKGAPKGFSRLGNTVKTGVKEGSTELLEEGITKFEGNRAAQNYDPSIDPFKGVAAAATMGGLQGGAVGSVTGMVSKPNPVQRKSYAEVSKEREAQENASNEIRALPSPEPIVVDTEGRAFTPEQGRQAQEMGLTPDVIRAGERYRSQRAETESVPALPAPSIEVDSQGNARTTEQRHDAHQEALSQEIVQDNLGYTPDVRQAGSQHPASINRQERMINQSEAVQAQNDFVNELPTPHFKQQHSMQTLPFKSDILSKTGKPFMTRSGAQRAAQNHENAQVVMLAPNQFVVRPATVLNNQQNAHSVTVPEKGVATNMQNRDRSRPASIEQMNRIASNPDYDRLGVGRSPNEAAPLVSIAGNAKVVPEADMGYTDRVTLGDGSKMPFRYAVVEAKKVLPSHSMDGKVNRAYFETPKQGQIRALNNGRVAGLQGAYQRNTAAKYQLALINDARAHGVSEQAILSKEEPILVRMYDDAENARPNIGALSNPHSNLGLSASEQAVNDARLIDMSQLDDSGVIDSHPSFLNDFALGLQQQGEDLARIKDAHGNYSRQFLERAKAAAFYKAYGDESLTSMIAESADPDLKNILSAMMASASEFGQIESGPLDIRSELVQAVHQIREARARGLRIDQFMAQQDMFGRDLLTDKFTQLLWENNRSPKRLAQGLREMAKFIHNEQSRSKNKDMFGSAISAEDIVSKIEEIIKENYEQEKSAEQERFNLAESSGDKRVDGIDGGGGKQRQQQRGKTQNSKTLRKRKIDSNEHKPRQPAGVSVSSVRKRETKKGKAFESRKDNIVENVNVDSIQKAAVAFMKKLPGASKLNVQVVQKASEINAVYNPSPLAEGVYYPNDDSGKVYLIADNLDSIERVHQVLAHEVIGHYGVEAFLGKEFGAILQQIPKIARAPKNADITGKEKPGDAHYATLESVQKLYGDISVEDQSREVLARIAETKAKPTFLATLYAQIKKALRKMGFNVQLSNADLRQVVVDSGNFLRQQHRDYLSRLKDVLTGAKENAHAPQKAKIAPVENWFVNKAAEFGLNLSGYSHVIDNSAARHIMNRHTNTSIESSRGQYVVTEKDFEALPAVTSSPDYLIFGSKNRLNKEQIGFIKRMSDNSILYFEEIRTGKKELAAVTLRKYPATKNVEAIASTLDPNVHDDGGNKVIVVDLKSKSNRPIESRRAPQTIRPGEQLSAAEAKLRTAALSKIGAFAKKDSIKDRITKIKANFKEKAVQGIFDQFAPLAKLSPTAFMQARLSKGSAGAVEYLLRGGAVKLTDGALDAVGGKGFEQVLAGLKGEHDLFLAWIAGNRASRLASEWEIVYHNGVTQRYPNEASARQAAKDTVGVTLRPASRENLFTAENIESLKKLNLGKMEDGSRRRDVYDQALKELNALQSSVLDVAQEAGLINKDSRALWESEFYIPFYRVMEEDATGTMGPGQIGGLVGQRAFKKLSGGTEKLGDLAVNVVSNWDHLLGASMKNLAAQNAMQEAVRLGIAQKVGSANKDSVRVMENGKEIHYLVDDPLILDALTALNFVGYKDPFMKVMRTFKHVLTIGVTISPTFRVRNVLRDSLQAISIDSNIKLNPIANIIDGWKRTAKGSMTMDKLLAGGGAIRFGSFTDGQGIGVKRMAAELNVDSSQVITSPSKLLALMRKSYDWYQHTGDRAETINRAAIYEAARAKGKSHLEASFAARDLMDFTAGGKFTAIRILSQILPFFNARLQGIYKLGRGAQENPARFWGVTGVVGLASALLYLSMKDDDDYKALPDWIRNAYWVTKLPGTQTMIYIPKPFEIGALGSIVERGTELAFAGNDYQIKDFSKSIMGIIGDQLAMNPIPQAAKPALEVAFNYDMFREQPIDSVNLQRLPPEERYTSKTSAGAVVLGSALGVSPKKLEHLARGYFGWIGMQALNASDYMIRPFTAMPDNPKRDLTRLDNWFVVGDFLKEANPQSSKYIQRFYDEQKEINQAYAAFNQARAIGDIERAKALIKSGKLDKYKFYNAVAQQMQKISKQIRLIESNSSLSAEEKRERLETLYRTRNQLAMIADERIRQK